MPEQVRVTSFDALESFRASLIVFITKANRSVDEVRDEVRRTRLWLQHDQRLQWEGEVHRWEKKLDQAEQELMSARMSGLRETVTMQQAAVNRAKRALAESGDKLRRVKLWNRDFDGLAEPLTKRLDGLREYLDHDMPKSVTYLVQAIRTLEAYAGPDAPENKPSKPSAPAETENAP